MASKINYSTLKNIFDNNGQEVFEQYLSKKFGRACIITKNPKYMMDLVNHYSGVG